MSATRKNAEGDAGGSAAGARTAGFPDAAFVEVTGRGIAGMLHPRPVYLITTCSKNARVNCASVAWVTPLSHTPPLVGLSIRPSSRTYECVTQSGECVINIVDASLRAAVEYCGNPAMSRTDKVEGVGLTLGASVRVAPPRLADALGWLECTVEREVQTGDHVLVVARVLAGYARQSFAGAWDLDNVSVLQCLSHDQFALATVLADAEEDVC